MKNLIKILFLMAFQNLIFGQISGNINYQSSIGIMPSRTVIAQPQHHQMNVTVKGMANLKPDSYIAVFGVTQFSETKEETLQKIDVRINNAVAEIKKKNVQEVFVDMVSFVPKYELVEEKKLFSKSTYNEVPAGFEIKKNIHIQFSNARDLDDFMSILAQNEIYDIIRVDVFAKNLEEIKNSVIKKAREQIKSKITDYQSILNEDFNNQHKSLSEGFSYMYPIEMYQSFVAYNNNLRTKSSGYARINEMNKNRNIYYQPMQNKDFDFVINPIIVEPSIQVLYEINILLTRKPEKDTKEMILITPNGDLKKISI